MTALRAMKLAIAAVKTARTHLATAREYARSVRKDDDVLMRMWDLQHDVETLTKLRDDIGLAESKRQRSTRRHGRAA